MENIRLGRQDATDEEVMVAARAAAADGFIMGMPDGYQTMLGDGGSGLALGGSLHLNGKALAGILNGGIALVHTPGKGVNAFGSFLTQFYLRHGSVELVFAFLKGADRFAQAELRQRHTLAPGGTGGLGGLGAGGGNAFLDLVPNAVKGVLHLGFGAGRCGLQLGVDGIL